MLVMLHVATQDATIHLACSKCGVEKPLTREHFQADAQKASGYRPDCKACRHAAYARKNTKSRVLQNRGLAAQGLKLCCICGDQKPFDAFSGVAKAADGLSSRCKQCHSERTRTIRQRDPARFDAAAKAYKARNRDAVRERARIYAAERRAADPKFRMRGAVTRLVGCFLKRRGHTKAGRGFFAAIGYTVEQLVAHVERQFLPGMTWENYGDWHLDHILPNASFDYLSMDDPEFRACWTLSNLRPLWKADNLRKSSARVTLL